MIRRAAALAALLLPAGAGPVAAQGSAPVLATALVNGVPLTISATRNLAFGTVVAGTPATVNPRTSANAGYFQIQGARRAEIIVTFMLPAQLRAGSGPFTMPLSFGAGAGCARNSPVQATCTLFDPAVGVTDRIRNQNPPNNTYHVWLGGTVTPDAAQRGGVYTASVTMTVAYTGN